MPGLAFNPYQTTSAAGTFSTETLGYIQGVALDEPAIRNTLAGGVLALTETLPIWGGCAITESIPTGLVAGSSNGPKAMGPLISRATGVAGTAPITGFCVFNQAHHMVATPQSQAPISFPGMSVHFHRLNTGIRIPLNCDPALANLQGGLLSQQVSWDFVGQRVVAFQAAYAANAITAASYNNGTGVATYTTSSAHGLSAGAPVSFTGITPAAYNGSYTALTASGSTITVQMQAGLNLANATAFGTLAGGGGALPIRILEITATGCMTVNYDPVGGNATWNRNGATLVALI